MLMIAYDRINQTIVLKENMNEKGFLYTAFISDERSNAFCIFQQQWNSADGNTLSYACGDRHGCLPLFGKA